MTINQLQQVYHLLRDQYPLILTSTLQVDDGFTEDMPIIIGQHHGAVFWLYLYDGEFIFSYEVPGQAFHDHCHPRSVCEAADMVAAFMNTR